MFNIGSANRVCLFFTPENPFRQAGNSLGGVGMPLAFCLLFLDFLFVTSLMCTVCLNMLPKALEGYFSPTLALLVFSSNIGEICI